MSTVFDEIEAGISVGQTVGVQVVEEDASYSTRDASVFDLEVIIAPGDQGYRFSKQGSFGALEYDQRVGLRFGNI